MVSPHPEGLSMDRAGSTGWLVVTHRGQRHPQKLRGHPHRTICSCSVERGWGAREKAVNKFLSRGASPCQLPAAGSHQKKR